MWPFQTNVEVAAGSVPKATPLGIVCDSCVIADLTAPDAFENALGVCCRKMAKQAVDDLGGNQLMDIKTQLVPLPPAAGATAPRGLLTVYATAAKR